MKNNKEILNKQELLVIKKFKKLAKIWPDTLWLWSGSSSLSVMKYSLAELPNGMMKKTLYSSPSVDPKGVVANIDGIANDGGDW